MIEQMGKISAYEIHLIIGSMKIYLLSSAKRDDVILATKVNWTAGPRPNDKGLSRRHIIESCNLSLQRLQTDYIDLYQVKHMKKSLST